MLPAVIEAAGDFPVTTLVATASGEYSTRSEKVWYAEYLPGEKAVARSRLVICNGGSPTVYQALSRGVPVIGIASNMDQYLNMSYVAEAGAGILIRAGQAKPERIRSAIKAILEAECYSLAAARIARACAQYRAPQRLGKLLRTVL